jgi:hypothetical protein
MILITWPYTVCVKTAQQGLTKQLYFKAILHPEIKLIDQTLNCVFTREF